MSRNTEAKRDLADCRKALRQVAADWSRAEDAERRRIAAGLHDDLGQLLAAMGLRLHEMRRWAVAEDQLASVDDTKRLLDQAVEVIRSLTFRLLSPPVEDQGLPAALGRVADRLEDGYGISCAVQTDGSAVVLPDEKAVAAFRVVRELLANVAKHSEATKAAVEIANDDDAIRITVTDDGRGFVPPDEFIPERSGVGLLVARERLAEIGGLMKIDSAIGDGTRVVVDIPLAGAEVAG